MSSVLSSPSPWPQLPRDYLGGVDAAYPDEDPTNDLLLGMAELDRGRAYLAYAEYRSVAALYDRLVAAREDTDGFVVDGFADAAARISKLRGTSRGAAETLLNDAVALRDRLPEVSECLRDGVIGPWHAQKAVSRTDLLAESSAAPAVDADIAATLRTKRGAWSKARFRDMLISTSSIQVTASCFVMIPTRCVNAGSRPLMTAGCGPPRARTAPPRSPG